jgi:hypothetical protein
MPTESMPTSPSRTPIRTPRAVPQGSVITSGGEATNSGCGLDVSTQLLTPEAFGKTYTAEETLVITVEFDAPHCKAAGVQFYGFHTSGSPWYEHACEELPIECTDRVGSLFVSNDLVLLPGTSGTIELSARASRPPHSGIGGAPSLEGFVLCRAVVDLNDGIIGGTFHKTVFTHPCGAVEEPPPSPQTPPLPQT